MDSALGSPPRAGSSGVNPRPPDSAFASPVPSVGGTTLSDTWSTESEQGSGNASSVLTTPKAMGQTSPGVAIDYSPKRADGDELYERKKARSRREDTDDDDEKRRKR